jgi:hypothetical protein
MISALPEGRLLDGAFPYQKLPDPALPDASASVFVRAAVRSAMNTRAVVGLVFGVFISVMLGLAAGALWMVVTLYQRQPIPWLVVPIAAVLAWAIRHGVQKPGKAAALLAALATLLSFIYVNMLLAAVQIAGSMGLGIIDTLLTAGSSMLWQLARLGFSLSDAIWTVLAMLLAAWLGLRPLPVKKPKSR